jgi:hypothetical protein
MSFNPESPCPDLRCPNVPQPVSTQPLPYANDTVYFNNLCPTGVTPQFSGSLPAWIMISGNSMVGAAGIFRAATKAAANELAQNALNDFVNNAFAKFQLTCDCSVLLPLMFPPGGYLPAPGVEIVHYHYGYGVGYDVLDPSWRQDPGAFPPTCLILAAWLAQVGGGSGNPWWDGVFNAYPTLPSNNANPQTGGVYMWRPNGAYTDFCRIGRIVSVANFFALYMTEQNYANPTQGIQYPLLFSFNVRCVNGIPVWLVTVNSEYGGTPGGMAGVWYKLGGYSPEGIYTWIKPGQTSPPNTAYTDFPEFNAGASLMQTSTTYWYVGDPKGPDQVPSIEIMTQVNLILLPKQEASSPPVLSSNNFIRYLNVDSHGLNGTFYTTDGSNNVYASTDGYTWSIVSTIAGANGLTDIAFGGGVFVATSKSRVSGKASFYVSGNAINWAEIQVAGGDLNCVQYGGGKFVACQSNQNGTVTSFYSPDGAVWTPIDTISPATTVRYLNGQFVIVGKLGQVSYSTDAVNWTNAAPIYASPQTFDVAYGGFKFVVTGRGRTFISFDLVNWNSYAFAENANIVSIAAGVFGFVAVTDTGNAYRSPDGIAWTQIMPYGQMKWTGEDNNVPFLTTQANFTIPVVGTPVTVSVAFVPQSSIPVVYPGMKVFITDGAHFGTFVVVSFAPSGSLYSMVVKWLDYPLDSTHGTVINSGALAEYLIPAGQSANVYVRGSGQFQGMCFAGTSHDAPSIIAFAPGGAPVVDALLSGVTWYADLAAFVASVSRAGSPGSPPDFYSSPDGSNWSKISATAPGGKLKSVCFWQAGTFVIT